MSEDGGIGGEEDCEANIGEWKLHGEIKMGYQGVCACYKWKWKSNYSED